MERVLFWGWDEHEEGGVEAAAKELTSIRKKKRRSMVQEKSDGPFLIEMRIPGNIMKERRWKRSREWKCWRLETTSERDFSVSQALSYLRCAASNINSLFLHHFLPLCPSPPCPSPFYWLNIYYWVDVERRLYNGKDKGLRIYPQPWGNYCCPQFGDYF